MHLEQEEVEPHPTSVLAPPPVKNSSGGRHALLISSGKDPFMEELLLLHDSLGGDSGVGGTISGGHVNEDSSVSLENSTVNGEQVYHVYHDLNQEIKSCPRQRNCSTHFLLKIFVRDNPRRESERGRGLGVVTHHDNAVFPMYDNSTCTWGGSK